MALQCNSKKEILFGTCATGDVNGRAVSFRNSDYYIVLIDDGTFTFANLLAKAMACSMPLKASDGLDIDRDVGAIERWINKNPDSDKPFTELFVHYVVNGNPNAAPQHDAPKQYWRLSVAWLDAMEFFILGHEYGHARLGHLEGAMRMRSLIARQGYSEIAMNWKQEFEADQFALELTLACLKSRHPNQSITYAGIEMFFHGIDLIYRTLARFTGSEYQDSGSISHPPIHLRISNLRVRLKELLPADQSTDAINLASLVAAMAITMRGEIERQVDYSIEHDKAKLHTKWLPKRSLVERVLSTLKAVLARLLSIFLFFKPS